MRVVRMFLMLSLPLLSLPALAIDPQTVDVRPDLALRRSDGAGGLVSGAVHVIATHPLGGVVVGGEFIRGDDGVVRTHLLRVRPDGTLDPDFDTVIASTGAARINAIAVGSGAIYVGGAFDTVGTQAYARRSLAKLDLQGIPDPAFDAGLLGNDEVHALALGEGKVYAGGAIVAHDAWGLARFDQDSGAHDPRWRARTQTVFRPEPSVGGRGQVHALLHTGADLVVGGLFEQIAGQPREYVARLSLQASDGDAAVLPYRVGLSGAVRALALDRRNGEVYLGGFFFIGQQNNLVRTRADGVLDTAFRPGARDTVSALALGQGWLYYGGNFRVDLQTPLYLARTAVNGNGLPDPGWLPLPDAQVLALAWESGVQRLWLGGRFEHVGEAARAGLARIGFAGAEVVFRDGFEH